MMSSSITNNNLKNTEGNCQFYLNKKKRFCRFQPKAGLKYCAEHACVIGVDVGRKRIPCPLNPSHNCYEDQLEKHIKKCNVTKLKEKTEQSEFFVKGINVDGPKTLSNEQVSVRDLTSEQLLDIIHMVDRLYKAHVDQVERSILEHPCVKEEVGEDGWLELDQKYSLKKELLQQSSLIGQLDALHLLSDNHCFVEMGAGKGKLSHWVQRACHSCSGNSFLLVDRSSVRYKMDCYHKEDDNHLFKRIKVDIADLCLGYVSDLHMESSVVVIGKHLCGGATDMGLKCAVETLSMRKHSLLYPTESFADNLANSGVSRIDRLRGEKDTDATIRDKFSWMSEKRNSEKEPNQSCVVSDNSEHVLTETVTDKMSMTFDNSKTHESSDMKGSSPLTDQQCKKADKDCVSSEATVKPASEREEVVDATLKQRNESSGIPTTDTSVIAEREVIKAVANSNDNVSTVRESESPNEKPSVKCPVDKDEPSAKVPRLGPSENDPSSLPSGVMIALCCHHRCDWPTYVGKNFMRRYDVTPEQFDLITRLSSWATCARVRAGESDKSERQTDPSDWLQSDHADTPPVFEGSSLRESLSVREREEIGRKCKRLIDQGRIEYLRSRGLKCFLREYVEEEWTPENVVLLATRGDN